MEEGSLLQLPVVDSPQTQASRPGRSQPVTESGLILISAAQRRSLCLPELCVLIYSWRKVILRV